LTDFFDAEAMVDTAGRVLEAPAEYRPLGKVGVATVRDRYSLEVCLPQHLRLHQNACSARRANSA
jgi:hypothetical protein